jgi:hypothetical protein
MDQYLERIAHSLEVIASALVAKEAARPSPTPGADNKALETTAAKPGRPAGAKPGAGAAKPGAGAKPGAKPGEADLASQGGETDAVAVPYDTVRDLVLKVSQTKGRNVAVDALSRFGVTSAKDLLPAQYGAVVADLEGLLAGGEGGLA